MRRLRITIVCEYATLNGGERSLLCALDHIPADSVEVSVLAPSSGPLAEELSGRRIVQEPFELHSIDGKRLPRAKAIDRLVRVCSRRQPDLVHANSLSMGRLTGAAADRLGRPSAAHLRDVVKLTRSAVADLNRNAALVAVSRAARDFHVAQGVDSERTSVIYNGVDCELFSPSANGKKHQLHRELGVPERSFLIASIGQVCLRKGQDVLAEAAALNADVLPDAHYVLIGERHSTKPESVEFERRLVQSFDAAGLGGRLHRLGRRTDVHRLLRDVDLLVHTAHQEPLGRVLLEAAAAGTPILATDVGGTQEILRPGQDAVLVPAGDPRAVATEIRRLACDEALRRQLADAARRRITSDFDVRSRAGELLRFWTASAEQLRRP